MQGELREIRQILEDMRTDVHELNERVQHLDGAIRGNGQPGLRSQYQELRHDLGVLKLAFRWFVGVGTTIGTATAIWAITR